tara:strand:- start:654 stop:1637 length:984 start_codon:yes stop_codon:yes gene_type:complete
LKKNILVIGGAGYIGSHIVLELCSNNYDVTVFDNLSTGDKRNLCDQAKFIQGDIRNLDQLEKLFIERFDAVFHFAALKAAGDSMSKIDLYATININGTINILNQMVKNKIKYFIFSSTAAVYGHPQYLPIDENHVLNPINFYGFTKLEVERLLKWYSNLNNIKYASLRYFNAAGYDLNENICGIEKEPANLLPIVMETAIGLRNVMDVYGDDYETSDGTGIRDYIHVTDLANAHILSLEYLFKNNKDITFNLSTGIGYSVLDVIKKAEEITKRSIKYNITKRRKGDIAELVSVSNTAKEIINWQCQFSTIDCILSSMWKIYQKNYKT